MKAIQPLQIKWRMSILLTIGTKRKATPQGGFGNASGNKGVVSLQTLISPINLAETRGFEPPIRVLAPMLP